MDTTSTAFVKTLTGIMIGVPVAFGVIVVLVFSVGVKFWCKKRRRPEVVPAPCHQEDLELLEAGYPRWRHEGAKEYSYKDLERVTNNFHPTRILGEGGFGVVYRGDAPDDSSKEVAIKKAKAGRSDNRDFLNEVVVLTKVLHRNLVKLLGYCFEKDVLLLVYEYIPNGTLSSLLYGMKPRLYLDWSTRLQIACETAEALAYLHFYAPSFPIIHRDVKTDNILLDENYSAKVGDFGISRLGIPNATHVTISNPGGTPGYIDPKEWGSPNVTTKTDVYSFGVVLLQLIASRNAIFQTRDSNEWISLTQFAVPLIRIGDLKSLVDARLARSSSLDEETVTGAIESVADLAVRCVQDDRPDMKQVVEVLQQITRMSNEKARKTLSIHDDCAGTDGDMSDQGWERALCDDNSSDIGGRLATTSFSQIGKQNQVASAPHPREFGTV